MTDSYQLHIDSGAQIVPLIRGTIWISSQRQKRKIPIPFTRSACLTWTWTSRAGSH